MANSQLSIINNSKMPTQAILKIHLTPKAISLSRALSFSLDLSLLAIFNVAILLTCDRSLLLPAPCLMY